MSDQPPQAPIMSSGEFRVGRVLSHAFVVLFRHFVKFILVALIVTLPSALIFGNATTAPSFYQWRFLPPAVSLFLFKSLVNLPFHTLAQAVVYYAAFQELRGRPFQLSQTFRQGFARFFPMLGLAIVWGWVITIGLVLLIVPGFMWLARFYVALPVCVIEGLGPIESMKRSALLTQGHRWKMLGLYLLSIFIGGIVGAVIGFALGAIGGAIGGNAVLTLVRFGTVAWSTLFSAYYFIVVAIVYHDLRVLKEGPDPDRIAAVFD